MLSTEYTLKHYKNNFRLFLKYCLSKYIHKFLFHGSYMNIIDNFGKRTDREKFKQVKIQWPNNNLKNYLPD